MHDGVIGAAGGLLGAGLGKALGGSVGNGSLRVPTGMAPAINLNGTLTYVLTQTDIQHKALVMAGAMAAATQLTAQAARGLAMAVQGGSNGDDPATEMAEAEAKANDTKSASSPSRQRSSKRRQYMGQNPNKRSTTYRDVVEKMQKEGKVVGEGEKMMVQASDGTWIPIAEAELCHQIDAMKWWKEFGKLWGPKHPKVREFMLDPSNYVLDKIGLNRSAGAKLKGIGYDPPELLP
jgi:hypothetical protein